MKWKLATGMQAPVLPRLGNTEACIYSSGLREIICAIFLKNTFWRTAHQSKILMFTAILGN